MSHLTTSPLYRLSFFYNEWLQPARSLMNQFHKPGLIHEPTLLDGPGVFWISTDVPVSLKGHQITQINSTLSFSVLYKGIYPIISPKN